LRVVDLLHHEIRYVSAGDASKMAMFIAVSFPFGTDYPLMYNVFCEKSGDGNCNILLSLMNIPTA
jgi:hypothetical protein